MSRSSLKLTAKAAADKAPVKIDDGREADASEEDVLDPIEIKRPIVLVPGIFGSDLWRKTRTGQQGSRLWPPYTAENGVIQLSKLSTLDFAVPKIATAGAVFLAIYDELLVALRQMGYHDDPLSAKTKTLWVFPYDWTQCCDDVSRDLLSFIEAVVLPSKTPAWTAVDIVGHSIGAIIARAARGLQGAPIVRSVFIDPPVNGSKRASFALDPAFSGPFFDRTVDWIFATIFKANDPLARLQRQIIRWRSVYDALPDDKLLVPYRTRGRKVQSAPAMEDELRRAGAFKARLATVPLETHVNFFCKPKLTKNQFIRDQLQKVFPGLKLPIRRTDAFAGFKEDRPAERPRLDCQASAFPISGTHMWAPSTKILHARLRQFLATA